MKIGLVCQNYPPATFEGGISHYSRLLAEGLVERGHRVSAVASTEFATSPPEPPAGQGALERVLLQGPWGCTTVAQIRAVARAKQWDAVILQFSPASFRPSFRLAWALTPFDGQKLTAFHTLWGGGFDRLLGLLTLWGSGKIIATNSEVMYLIEKYAPPFLRKTYWIPIGSNILPSLPPEAPPPGSPPVISYFGMLYPRKGLDLILDCLQALKAEGYGFRFKFIGGGMLGHQQYEADFRKGIAERHLQGQVEHLGLLPAERVSAWISRSRFLFLPYEKGVSDRRGTLMAALAHGKAILTSPPAVEMPFLQNGKHLCWPEKNAVPGYLALLKALLTDDGLVTRLEEGARGLATNFTWDRIVSDYDRVLEQP